MAYNFNLNKVNIKRSFIFNCEQFINLALINIFLLFVMINLIKININKLVGS